jgi:chromosome segregation ATPase
MEAALIVGAVLCLAAAAVLAITANRRSKTITELSARLAEGEQRLREARQQFETKCKETDEIRSKLDKLRDEAKKAKKRAFELERVDKEKASVPPAAVPQEDDLLLDTRTQARQAAEAAARATEEKNHALEQLEKVKAELATAKQSLKARHEEALKAERGDSERTKRLETEVAALQERLEQARRKTRTDAQVYRITKSKLDLAFEKIASLERLHGAAFSTPPSEGAAEAPVSDASRSQSETQPALPLKTES